MPVATDCIGLVAVLVADICLVVSVSTHSWMVVELRSSDVTFSFRLGLFEGCAEGSCHELNITSQWRRTHFNVVRALVIIAILASSLAAILSAVFLVKRYQGEKRIAAFRHCSVLLLILAGVSGGIAAIVYVATVFTDMTMSLSSERKSLELGFSFGFCVAGCLLCTITAIFPFISTKRPRSPQAGTEGHVVIPPPPQFVLFHTQVPDAVMTPRNNCRDPQGHTAMSSAQAMAPPAYQESARLPHQGHAPPAYQESARLQHQGHAPPAYQESARLPHQGHAPPAYQESARLPHQGHAPPAYQESARLPHQETAPPAYQESARFPYQGHAPPPSLTYAPSNSQAYVLSSSQADSGSLSEVPSQRPARVCRVRFME